MEVKDIERIAVIGAGVIGSSWVTNFVFKGYMVNLWLYGDEEKERARQEIKKNLEIMVANGVFKHEEIPHMMEAIRYTTSLEEAVRDVQLIQEATPDYLDLKQKMLADIDRFASPKAIYASSTSFLLITDIVKHSQHAKRCIGAHPYNPPHLIPLVEITKPKGEKGSTQTAEAAADFYRAIGKEPIILKKDISGFIANSIQSAVYTKSKELLEGGVCTVEDLDKAISFGPGMRWASMGPNLIYQLGGGQGGIKGLMTHVKPDFVTQAKDPEKEGRAYEAYADILQQGVDQEMANRKREFGNTNESLRAFRDKMLIDILRTHKKI